MTNLNQQIRTHINLEHWLEGLSHHIRLTIKLLILMTPAYYLVFWVPTNINSIPIAVISIQFGFLWAISAMDVIVEEQEHWKYQRTVQETN